MTTSIKDLKGNEIRIQPSQDRRFVDIYFGPEKVRTVRRSKPVKFRWWTVHRLLDVANARKFAQRFTKVVKQLR